MRTRAPSRQAVFDPGDARHGGHALQPGASFRTVPARLALSAGGGPDDAFAALTRYRRAPRRPPPTTDGCPSSSTTP